MAGGKVLILEDEYQIAALMAEWVVEAGYCVVGPAPTVDSAQALITKNGIDAALLDVRLGDERSFDLATRLQAMRVPFAFVSAYSQALVPAEFDQVPALAKPVDAAAVSQILGRLLPLGTIGRNQRQRSTPSHREPKPDGR